MNTPTTIAILFFFHLVFCFAQPANDKIDVEDDFAEDGCTICGTNPYLYKPYCLDLASEINESVKGNATDCLVLKVAWTDICCKNALSENLPDPDTFPACNTCIQDGHYPWKPTQMLNVLYEAGSCAQFWVAGQRGQLTQQLCDVHQQLT